MRIFGRHELKILLYGSPFSDSLSWKLSALAAVLFQVFQRSSEVGVNLPTNIPRHMSARFSFVEEKSTLSFPRILLMRFFENSWINVEAFQMLKSHLHQDPHTQPPWSITAIHLEVSESGIGAVLSQCHGIPPRLNPFYSRLVELYMLKDKTLACLVFTWF